MNTILQWLTAPEWSQVVKTLLHSLWQGALIALALALLMRRLTSAASRYRCSLAAIAAIPLAGIVTWAVLNASNHRPLPTPEPPVAVEATHEPVLFKSKPDTTIVLLAKRPPAPPQSRWTAWMALAWLIGASVMLGRAGVKVAGAERLRRSCRPLDNPRVAELVAEARRAVGLVRRIRVTVTDKLTSPAVVGVLVPTLVLPLTLLTTLTPEQIRFILLHELAHIRRGDYFANLFQLFTEALLFFNPAVWWISHQIRREREACCDALAIELSGAPTDYARTLLHVAESMLNPTPSAAPAFGGEREPSSLSDRVQRLLVPGYRPSLRLTWRAMIGAFVLGTALLVLSAEGTRVAVAQVTKQPTQTRNENEALSQVNQPKLESQPPVRSNSPGVEISGLNAESRVEYNIADGKTVITNGGAVRSGDATIWADSIQLDHSTGRLIASGNTRMEQPGFTNNSARVELNIYSNQPSARAPAERIVYTSEKRRAIVNKLTQITLEQVDFNALPLNRVALALSDESRRRDPEGRGVNIIINPNATSAEPGPAIDVGDIRITVNPPLTNVRLADALDAIVKSASIPIKLSIEEYAVVISLKGNKTTPLFMREFNLDPALFLSRLPGKGYSFETSGSTTNNPHAQSIRQFLADAGVDLQPAEGKSLFYKDRKGILLVRATLDELDRVEQLVLELNRPEPQINIKTRFVEIPASQLEVFVPELTTSMKSDLAQNWTGMLTEPQMNQVLLRLKTNKSFSLLSEGEVTTLSGRQAQLQVVEVRTIVTGINPKALTPPGITSTNKDGSGETLVNTTNMLFGPVIDIIPAITPDGYSVAMTVIPRMTEFLGYAPSTNTVVYENGKKKMALVPLPQIRLRQMTINTAIRDGMTLVLGASPVEKTNRIKDKVPVLGDIPGLGRLFLHDSSQVSTNVLLVFVTPTIVDPAANRIHDFAGTGKAGNGESFLTRSNLFPVYDKLPQPQLQQRQF